MMGLVILGAIAGTSALEKKIARDKEEFENFKKEQAWWKENEARLRATMCPTGQTWIPEYDRDVIRFFKYNELYPATQGQAAPVPGAISYKGYCVPNPVTEKEKSAAFLRQIQDERVRRDLSNIDELFSRLVAQGRTPEAAAAEVTAPFMPYLQRYASEGYDVSTVKDPKNLLARNSTRITDIRREMGLMPAASSLPQLTKAPSRGVPSRGVQLSDIALTLAVGTGVYLFARAYYKRRSRRAGARSRTSRHHRVT